LLKIAAEAGNPHRKVLMKSAPVMEQLAFPVSPSLTLLYANTNQ
jgi:hypothetical protein